MNLEIIQNEAFIKEYGGTMGDITNQYKYNPLKIKEGEIELIFNNNFNNNNFNLINENITFDIELDYNELDNLINDGTVLEIELVINDKLNLIEQNLVNIPLPIKDDTFITMDVELIPNDKLVLSESETLQLSVKNDWNIYEKFKYKNLINLKNNKWNSISILFLIIENDNLLKYLNSFYINEAYVIDNEKYYNLFNENYYNEYKKTINEIRNLNYINKNVNTNDSCFIKKQAPNIIALIIGINYIGTDHSLTGAINDANNMETFLKTYYGTQIDIVKMTDNTTSKLPTTKNIENEILNLLTLNKNIIFYFAGHISKKYNIDNIEEPDLSNERIKTLDGYLSDNWFYTNFIQKINKNIKCRIYIDSCYSLGFSDFKYKYKAPNNVELNQNIENVQCQIISINSSNEYTKAVENNGQGIFTKELIDSFDKFGNYNIIESFDILSTANIMATFKFDREPILLL